MTYREARLHALLIAEERIGAPQRAAGLAVQAQEDADWEAAVAAAKRGETT